jgi:hypothetical protein
MDAGFEGFDDRQLVAVIDAALDALSDDRLRLASDAEQLGLLLAGLRVGARLHAWQARLAGRIESGEVAWRQYQTSTSTLLAEAGRLTLREARRLVTAGTEQARFPVVGAAALAGGVLPGQAEAITHVLAQLPEEFPADMVGEGEVTMVGFAATHNAAELRRLSGHLVETLAPDTAEELEAARVEREYRHALRERYLEFTGDGHGSVLLRGSLPVADAEGFIRIVDSYAAAAKRGVDLLDPLAEPVSPSMRRADALLAMVAAHQRRELAPLHGGDRPRIVLTMSYDTLLDATLGGVCAECGHRGSGFRVCDDRRPGEILGGGSDGSGTRAPGKGPKDDGRPTAVPPGGPDRQAAGAVAGTGARLVGTGEPVPAHLVRQWLCDADLLPVVLGGPSEILDVGQAQRLVTPGIRAALEVRDGGCVFPGCNAPPAACHAHHIIPWYRGGPTALWNLVLLCPHHHGIIEPERDPAADRWTLTLRADGISEIRPPRRVDPTQRPRLHARFHTQNARTDSTPNDP